MAASRAVFLFCASEFLFLGFFVDGVVLACEPPHFTRAVADWTALRDWLRALVTPKLWIDGSQEHFAFSSAESSNLLRATWLKSSRHSRYYDLQC